MANNYRLPTKLQEGNVFTGVSLSMMEVGIPGPRSPMGRVSTQAVGMSGVSILGGEYLGSICPVVSTWEVSTLG